MNDKEKGVDNYGQKNVGFEEFYNYAQELWETEFHGTQLCAEQAMVYYKLHLRLVSEKKLQSNKPEEKEMTFLGYENIETKSNNQYVTTMQVNGDLSYSYNVRPIGRVFKDHLIGVGIPANKLSDVDKILALISQEGYDKAYSRWVKEVVQVKGYKFGGLTGLKAEEYAQDSRAYGEVAEKYRCKIALRKVRWKINNEI